MSFSASLANGLSGMNAAKLRAEVLSFNIANAATDGFARRSVNLESVSPGGVRATGIERADAGRTERQLFAADGRLAGADIRAGATDAINGLFGEPGDQDGLYATYLRFEQGIEDLRLTPESGAAQLGLLRLAGDLADTFRRLDGEAQAMRLDADAGIAASVETVNASLEELERLNAEARKPQGLGMDTLAERQRSLVETISKELDVNVSGQLGDRIEIRTKGGILLLGDEAHTLAFTRAGTASFELDYASGDFSGITVDGYDITPGTTQGIADGRLAAQFAVRDVIAQDFATRLDGMAQDLSSRMAGADSTSAEGLFVLSAGTSSAAQRIGLNPVIDPAQGGELFRIRDGAGAATSGPAAGEGVLADMLAALGEALPLPAATGSANPYSFKGAIGAMSSQLGTQKLRADDVARAAGEARQGYANDVARLTAVDTDRELQDLMMVEQAFAANARVVSAVDDMLSRLMEL